MRKYMKPHKSYKFWTGLIILLISVFLVSCFWGKDIIEFALKLFTNPNGDVDMAIFWTAIASIATLFLGIVSIVQNSRLNKRNRELQESNDIIRNASHVYSCNSPKIKDNIATVKQDSPTSRENRNKYPKVNEFNLIIKEPCWYTLSLKMRYAFSNRPTKFAVKDAKLELIQNGSRHNIHYKDLETDFKDITPDTQDKMRLFLLFEIKKLNGFSFSDPYEININMNYIFANTWDSRCIVFTEYLCAHNIVVENEFDHTTSDLLVIAQSSPYKVDKI